MSSVPPPEPPPSPDHVPIRVTVAAYDAELAADRLFGAGASAVSELARDDGAVDLLADPERDALASLDAHFGSGAVQRVLEPDDAASWKDHAQVLVVGDRLVVRPEWLEPPALGPGQVEVVVAAAEAFGSGAHPTTRMCLELVDSLVGVGDRVLDVGSGSGVLAVAAALLGAGEVRCHDVAPEAVEATARSATSSGVADRVAVSIEPVERTEFGDGFDLVLANLLIPIIEQLGATLSAAVTPGGHLIVSGVLVEQRDRAIAACAPLDVVDERRDGDWVALALRRGSSPAAH
ncbi:MAG: 50S ribosomal protein L11 methyltransferase [Actinomycetota bacterium]|nr:50S ribosomal protein L11 methyltransferase [Actinomycetota bacterium]